MNFTSRPGVCAELTEEHTRTRAIKMVVFMSTNDLLWGKHLSTPDAWTSEVVAPRPIRRSVAACGKRMKMALNAVDKRRRLWHTRWALVVLSAGQGGTLFDNRYDVPESVRNHP